MHHHHANHCYELAQNSKSCIGIFHTLLTWNRHSGTTGVCMCKSHRFLCVWEVTTEKGVNGSASSPEPLTGKSISSPSSPVSTSESERIFRIRMRSDREAIHQQIIGYRHRIDQVLSRDENWNLCSASFSATGCAELFWEVVWSVKAVSDIDEFQLTRIWSAPNKNNNKEKNTKATRQTVINPWNSNEITVTLVHHLWVRRNLRFLLLIPRKPGSQVSRKHFPSSYVCLRMYTKEKGLTLSANPPKSRVFMAPVVK